jgi:superfamily II DNA or RNA helicase
MVNLTVPELAEIQTPSLPGASLEALYALRTQLCNSAGKEYTLQPQQRLLRRILSPDSPTRNLLMVHGTGVGKTCTAIQIAEEYILRPEFQDKKVLVVASQAVQENFKTQIFDMTRVGINANSTLTSKQCTGRRYLEMLLRIESEPKNWNDEAVRGRLKKTADKIIDEFYEFQAYNTFGTRLNEKLTGTEADIDEAWVHTNFDNRLIIIDEAHNITTEETAVANGLERLVKVADGLVLVLLTATPMYDTFEEIIFFMNLFLWNERKQPFTTRLTTSAFFTPDAELKPGESETVFREWCQTYVSYAKGESPFTFPFRLPPPDIAPNTMVRSFSNKEIGPKDRVKYLSLVASVPQGEQKTVLTTGVRDANDAKRQAMMAPTLSVFPGNKTFIQTFSVTGDQLKYKGEPFLTPAALPNYSSKFASAIHSIEASSGVCLVYSNYVERGAKLFAMSLEEHGFKPYRGTTILKKTSYTGPSKGNYILISSEANDAEISRMLEAVKRRTNVAGKDIKVVVTSPLAAEGIDFRFIRQVHILDPWWNMSRIEQVVGRALRTCSHQDLPTNEQNCTVYLHVVRPEPDREAFDEYTYRTRVEPKGMRIAKVRKVLAESAMDCPIQLALPADWRELEVPQIRDEGHEDVVYRLKGMMAPAFDESPDVEQCKVTPSVKDPDHTRPLSTYLDSRDEILTKLGKLFIDKSIWDREQLFSALRPFSRDVVVYTLQQAIATSFRFSDSFGRASVLESKGDLYALAPLDMPNSTVVERTTRPAASRDIQLPEPQVEAPAPPPEVAPDALDLRRTEFPWPKDGATRFTDATRDGYVFDHQFSAAEKKAYLATNPTLPFVERIRIAGSTEFASGDPTDLVGEELTRYTEWVSQLIKRFIGDRTKMFASVSEGGELTLSPATFADGVPTRINAEKSFAPTVCGHGKNSVANMKLIAKYIDAKGVGLPAGLQGGQLCTYAELLAREEHNIVWYTPEELKTLLSDTPPLKAKSTILKAFKSM